MKYTKSNQRPVFVEGFQTPKTQAEFDALSYPQKVALFEQQPSVYKRFTKQPEDEEKQW